MQNMPIGIFRGDDTDAFSYQTIVGTINTDLDLTGCKAVFRYLGFSMEFDPIPEDRKLTIVIPADETKKFPPGLGYASLRVYDSEGRLKTFSNRIMVFVATKTPMFGSDEFEVDFNVRASLEPLKFFVGPNPDDFDEYRGYVEKVIDRASAAKYGLAILLDAIDSDLGADDGVAATPVAVKAAYAAIIEKLTDDYYTAEQTDEAIDRVAAYYITYDAAGNPFPTYAALANATTVYSGGQVRVPTRNDYCVVLADETHDNAEYRYIYAVADGETTGSWQPQFPVEGVMTVDPTVTKNSQNPVASSGIWSAIWGALSALPTGFSSLYDWCVAQLSKYRDKLDLNVYGRRCVVSFPDGYSITYEDDTYVASSGGETIEFYGPITSTAVPWYNFWVPYEYKGATDFDPAAQSAWCLFGDIGNSAPDSMSYRIGPLYSIANWNTETPTLTLSYGEAMGDAPTMTRPSGATGDTLAKASQLAGKQSALSAQQLANIAAVSDALAFDATHSYAAGDPVVYNGTLYTFTATHTGAWTGSDVSAVDIIARLAGKLSTSGGTVTGNLEVVNDGFGFTVKDASGNYLRIYHNTVAGDFWYVNYFVANVGSGELRLPYDNIIPANVYSLAEQFNTGTTYAPNSLCIDYEHGVLYRCVNPNGHTGAWVAADFAVATVEDVLAALRTGKLDSTSAAPAFSSDSSVSYAVGSHCTYNGKLYRCTTATTGGTWVASKWTADTVAMKAPNPISGNLAALDAQGNPTDSTIPAANVALKSEIPYDCITITTGQLQDHAKQKVTLNAATTTLTLPALTDLTGKVSDFGIDVVNGYEVSGTPTAASFSLAGTIGTDYNLIVPEGEDWSEMSALAAGEMAVYYFTLSAFAINDKPTWEVMKKVVTLVPVPSAP